MDEKVHLQEELDSITLERQQIITWGRKNVITQEDMEYHLGALTLQELSLKRELATHSEVASLHELENWEQAISEYFFDLQAGMASLDVKPHNEKEAEEIFRLKKDIVKALVKRVYIAKDKELSVEIHVDVLAILCKAAGDFMPVQQVGTYIHKPTCHAHPRQTLTGG